MSFANVDWSRTRAYVLGHIGQVYIPRAADMSEADYESLRDELRGELLEMEHPVSGERIIDRVYRREELCHGPYTNLAPDLILQPRAFRYVAFGESEFASNLIVGPGLHTGHHRLEGILIMQGAGVRQGVELKDASIADSPVRSGTGRASAIDGQTLQAAFTDSFVEKQPFANRKHAAKLRRERPGWLIQRTRRS